MDLKFNQLKYRTSNIASTIKKLESKFQRNEPGTNSFRSNQSSLVSASTSSNESFTKSARHQSPKFLQLFQKRMDLPNKAQDIDQDQFELNEHPTTKPILRKMTSTSSIGSSSSASSTTSSTNESIDPKIAEPDSPVLTNHTVDSAPCVLPSFLRQSRTPTKFNPSQQQPQVISVAKTTLSTHLAKFVAKDSELDSKPKSQVTEKNFSTKLENLSISKPFGSYQQQPSTNLTTNTTTTATFRTTYDVPKTTGRSSYTSGFVKNNAAMFNRTSDPTPASYKK